MQRTNIKMLSHYGVACLYLCCFTGRVCARWKIQLGLPKGTFFVLLLLLNVWQPCPTYSTLFIAREMYDVWATAQTIFVRNTETVVQLGQTTRASAIRPWQLEWIESKQVAALRSPPAKRQFFESDHLSLLCCSALCSFWWASTSADAFIHVSRKKRKFCTEDFIRCIRCSHFCPFKRFHIRRRNHSPYT